MKQGIPFILAICLAASLLQSCRVEDVQELVAFFQGESPADYTQEKAVTRAHAALVEYTRQEHLDIKAFKGPYLKESTVNQDPSFRTYDVYYISPTHYFSYFDYVGHGVGHLKNEGDPNHPESEWLDRVDPYSPD